MKLSIETRYNIGDMTTTVGGTPVKVIDLRLNCRHERIDYLLEYDNKERCWVSAYELMPIDDNYVYLSELLTTN